MERSTLRSRRRNPRRPTGGEFEQPIARAHARLRKHLGHIVRRNDAVDVDGGLAVPSAPAATAAPPAARATPIHALPVAAPAARSRAGARTRAAASR